MSALTIQQQLQQTLEGVVKKHYPETPLEASVDKATNPQFGDYASSIALSLAKRQQQSPLIIANKLAEALRQSPSIEGLIKQVVVAPPGFINITVTNQALLEYVTNFQDRPLTHPQQPGKGKTVMVEFSSPNIAKPFNVGHLRSTIIGDSLARAYEYLGYTVLRDNHLGDWGTQYGKLAYAVEQWGDWGKIEANPIPELFQLYVQINEETKDNPDLQEAARDYFKKLEEGDQHVRQLWQKLSDLSLTDFNQLYQQFGIHFNVMLGESFYEPYLKQTIQECLEAGVATESEGALIVNFDDPKLQKPPLMIRKSNGTTTYATRDLAGIKYRMNHFKLDKLVIEIGNEQEFYFKQIIAAAAKMGWIKPGQVLHVGHGLFLGSGGKKLSTRKGETVWLRELVKELEDKAAQIVAKKSPEMSSQQRQQIAQTIAIGALKYNDLSQNRLSNIVFDKDKALSLEGNSSPYLQYTIARARSVLKQATITQTAEIVNVDITPSERALAAHLIDFHQVVARVAEDYLPSNLATFLFQAAQKFNAFYQSDPILIAPTNIRQRRLELTIATVNILTVGLTILGVAIPERM